MLSSFLKPKSQKPLALATLSLAIGYTYFIATLPPGNDILFWVLIATQFFYVWQISAFVYTVWGIDGTNNSQAKMQITDGEAREQTVDIFITVAGEPVEIVAKTVRAARAIRYEKKQVYILNDGRVAQKENWTEIENLARDLEVFCITRTVPGGAKAGNLNNALAQTGGELVAVFDADHVPHPDFLKRTAVYFTDPRLGFVQTPQYYQNFFENTVAQAAWDQQKLFFGPLMNGKNNHNAVIMCGTNMLIRRTALEDVGGFVQESIAEDFLTGLRIHAAGYRSVYVPIVLAKGLAPFDLASYARQQFRWARGSLEALVSQNPLLTRGLTFAQRIEYASSATYFLTGPITLITASLPIVFFLTGEVPLVVSGMNLAAIFIPYMLCVVLLLNRVSNGHFRFFGAAFSVGSFWIHTEAVAATIIRKKSNFAITPKHASVRNGLELLGVIWPHAVYIFLSTFGFGFGLAHRMPDASLANNLAWAFWHISFFLPMLVAGVRTPRVGTMTEEGRRMLRPALLYRLLR